LKEDFFECTGFIDYKTNPFLYFFQYFFVFVIIFKPVFCFWLFFFKKQAIFLT